MKETYKSHLILSPANMSNRSLSRGRSNMLKVPVGKESEVQRHPKRRRTASSVTSVTAADAQSATANQSERDVQLPMLTSKFIALEKALIGLQRKKRVADWPVLREAAGRFCGEEVLLSDINLIMEIHPKVYSLTWRTTDTARKHFELCVKLPNDSLGRIETRSNAFRDKLDEWCCLNPGDHVVAARSNYIPDMPAITEAAKAPMSTASIVALAASEQRNALTSSYKAISGSDGLKYLRDQAVLRDQNKGSRAAEQLKEKNTLDLRNRILSLPTLCDALRSRCLADNRLCLRTSELMRILVSELFLTRQELAQRLSLLSGIIPEFITLVPADDIVPVSTVRLNLQAPYGVVRRKVISYIASVSDNI